MRCFSFHELNDGYGPIGLPPLAYRNARFEIILHAVRNEAVAFLAIVPSPPQLIFQLDTFSTEGEG